MKSWIWFLLGAVVLAVVSSVITGVVTRNVVKNNNEDQNDGPPVVPCLPNDTTCPPCGTCPTASPSGTCAPSGTCPRCETCAPCGTCPTFSPSGTCEPCTICSTCDAEGTCPVCEVCSTCGGDLPTGNPNPAPEGFIWATATAAFQVEGAWNEGGRGWANWDYYLNVLNLAGGDTGEDGIRFIEKMEDDIALWKELGVSHARVSFSWPRLIPSGYLNVEQLPLAWQAGVETEDDVSYLPTDVWFDSEATAVVDCLQRTDESRCIPGRVKIGVEQQGIDLYNRLFDLLDEAGITPMITIYHWDHPLPLQTWGSWEDHVMVDRFADYAELVLREFGNRCDRWIVFNEPYIGPALIELSFIRGVVGEDPNIGNRDGWVFSPASYFQVRHHITVATARAYQIAEELKQSGNMEEFIEIGTTIAQSPARSETNDPETLQLVRYSALVTHLWDIETSLVGRLPHGLVDFFRTLGYDAPTSIATWDEDLALIAAHHAQFLGINFYSPYYIEATDHWMGFDSYYPEGAAVHGNGVDDPNSLRDQLVLMHNDYGGVRTYITENGYGTPNDAPQDELVDGGVDDRERCSYITRHIKAVLEARALGANVQSYTLWSSHDNLEWTSGYAKRFGSIYVDYDGNHGEPYGRFPKKSYFAYQQIIANNGLFEADLCDTVQFRPESFLER